MQIPGGGILEIDLGNLGIFQCNVRLNPQRHKSTYIVSQMLYFHDYRYDFGLFPGFSGRASIAVTKRADITSGTVKNKLT